MITEEQYVLDTFRTNFDKLKDKRIILYGTGGYSKTILENMSDYNFIGVMDGYKTDGNFLGYDILDYNLVLEKKVEIIIIVARSSNTKVIYNRISDFCKKNNIIVMDIYGENLIERESIEYNDNEYFNKNEEELKHLIDINETISFDIFDTLVMRYTLISDDVFEIIGRRINNNDFIKFRKQSVKDINANIYEIYDEYRKITGISDKEKEELINLEIEIEKSLLVKRHKMVELFNYALSKGKKVYLISDMYFTKEILKDILDSLDIVGYTDIFISCEYRLLKTQGLFKKYKENIKSNSYLHIGDDFEADGKCAEINSIPSYLIKSAYEMLDISMYKTLLNNANSLSERILVGLFIERAFNNPFRLYNSKGRLRTESIKDRGYLFIAPLITTFMIWLINNLKKSDYDKILFAARDGFLASNLYSKTKKIIKDKLPEGIYFLTSRMAAGLAGSTTQEDLSYFASYSYLGNPDEMLRKRFFLEDKDILEYKEGEDFNEYVLKHKDKIIDISNKMKQNYLEYINSLGISSKDKLAFFDFVSSGTSHFNLNKLLEKTTKGFYFIHIVSTYKKKKELDISSLYKAGNMFEIKNYLFENYLFLEYIMSSCIPSLKYFNEKGEPIYLEESRSSEELKNIKTIQEAIEEYYNLYLEKFLIFDDISPDFSDILFSFMDKKYSDVFDEFSKDIVLENEFSNKDFLLKG